MKISVEIELTAEELPLAQELITTLQQITTQVRTRVVDTPQTRSQNNRGGPSPNAQDNVPLVDGLALESSSNAGGPGGMEGGDWQDRLRAQVAASKYPDQRPAAAEYINALIPRFELNTLRDELLAAFTEVVFTDTKTNGPGAPPSILPYCDLLPLLADPLKTTFRDSLVKNVLQVLTRQRPVTADRREFFVYVECFAAMAKHSFVSVTGAITTITTLLRKTGTRCVAVTMLGKTTELCLTAIKEKCEPQILQQLRSTLESISEEVFRYDINYIQETLGWAVSQTGGGPIQGLRQTDSWKGHTEPVFALAVDTQTKQCFSAAKDGLIVTWTDGVQDQALSLPSHYACSLDVNPLTGSLYASGVTRAFTGGGVQVPPCIARYKRPMDGNQWALDGMREFSNHKLISCIKTLADGNQDFFVTGESTAQDAEIVAFYDASRDSIFDIAPVQTYNEHREIVSSLCAYPGNTNGFFSGSRDCTVKLWDRRSRRSSATFGLTPVQQKQTGVTPTRDGAVPHTKMITTIAAFGHIFVSAGLDGEVVAWDTRSMSAPGSKAQPLTRVSIDGQPILRVSLLREDTCAVATVKGLYTVDFTGGKITPAVLSNSPGTSHNTPGRSRKQGRFHDFALVPSRSQLIAAGDDGHIALFSYD